MSNNYYALNNQCNIKLMKLYHVITDKLFSMIILLTNGILKCYMSSSPLNILILIQNSD